MLPVLSKRRIRCRAGRVFVEQTGFEGGLEISFDSFGLSMAIMWPKILTGEIFLCVRGRFTITYVSDTHVPESRFGVFNKTVPRSARDVSEAILSHCDFSAPITDTPEKEILVKDEHSETLQIFLQYLL